MKKLTLLLSLVFAAGVAVAADNTATSGKSGSAMAPTKSDTAKSDTAKSSAAAKSTTHHVTAEVVSADTEKKELTIKDDKGENHTAPVEGKAIAELKSVKPGEKVTVTCRDNEKGEHQAITAIHPARVSAKKAASTKAESKSEASKTAPKSSSEKPAEKPAQAK